MKMRVWLTLLLTLVTPLLAEHTAAAVPPMRRVAILVGANDPPPGRPALRYARNDAQNLAAVLEQVGGFATADTHVLLDPHPQDLLAALGDAERVSHSAGNDVLFVFYYSGHSDGHAIFPHGEELALTDLRSRIDRLGARIRVGILDTCRGGSWTQSKGISLGPPPDMADLMNVDTEGTALVSSSSGLENAHEVDTIRGSFFTHYFATGLRGAADRGGDGTVTLQEAFDYARERTVHDSARLAVTPQHPSFDLALRGRQDIVLSVLASTSALQVTPARADVEIIQLAGGVTVADLPQSQSSVRIAVPPGRYLVRTVVGGNVYAKEVEVRTGEAVTIGDGELEETDAALALKGPPLEDPSLGLWGPAGGTRWRLHLSVGVGADARPSANVNQGPFGRQSLQSTSVGYYLGYRITDRLSWNVPWPAFSYRLGDPGGVEVVPFLGLASNGWNSASGLSLGISGGINARFWTASNQWVSLGGSALLPPYRAGQGPNAHLAFGDEIVPNGHVGYGVSLDHRVVLHGGLGLSRFYAFESTGWQYRSQWVSLSGGVSVWVSPRLALDLNASVSTETHANLGSYEGFNFGTTLAF